MRNMSFNLTKEQFRNRTKTVTRRLGWWHLKPGDIIMGVEKSQGLKKGEKIVRLGTIRIISVRPEPLYRLTRDRKYGRAELVREGFPEANLASWVDWFCQCHAGCRTDTEVNRIEFEYC